MVEAEDLKIYDMRCHLGLMFVSWKYFFPEVLIDYSIYFLLKMYLEKISILKSCLTDIMLNFKTIFQRLRRFFGVPFKRY